MPLHPRDSLRTKLAAPAALALVLGVCFALILPQFSGPDEKGHVVYIAALAQGRLPLVPATNTADFATLSTYEAQQPPLFYLAAAPGYALLGHDPVRGLYLARLLCVAALVVTVLCIGWLGRELGDASTGVVAALLVATNPVIVYVCSMANNESWAVALSALSAVAAAKAGRCAAGQNAKRTRFMALVALLGGCALLAKLTAVAGVIAAAWLAGGFRREATPEWEPAGAVERRTRAAIIVAGACGLWLIWGIYMTMTHGSPMPSPFNKPLYSGGPQALLLFPLEALFYAFVLIVNMAIGLVLPQWLQQTGDMYFYLTGSCRAACYGFVYTLFGAGVWIIAWLIYGTRRARALRFLPLAFGVIALMLIGNMYFRDLDNIYAPARYAPAVAVFVMLMAASQFRLCRPAVQKILVFLWCGLSLLQFAQIYRFFL